MPIKVQLVKGSSFLFHPVEDSAWAAVTFHHLSDKDEREEKKNTFTNVLH